MIVMLALFVLWVLGLIAKITNQHRQYQANTVKHKNVLSVNYLGLRVANDFRFIMNEADIVDALEMLYNLAYRVSDL